MAFDTIVSNPFEGEKSSQQAFQRKNLNQKTPVVFQTNNEIGSTGSKAAPLLPDDFKMDIVGVYSEDRVGIISSSQGIKEKVNSNKENFPKIRLEEKQENGSSFQYLGIDNLSSVLLNVMENDDIRQLFGQYGSEHISSVEDAVNKEADIVEYAKGKGKPKRNEKIYDVKEDEFLQETGNKKWNKRKLPMYSKQTTDVQDHDQGPSRLATTVYFSFWRRYCSKNRVS